MRMCFKTSWNSGRKPWRSRPRNNDPPRQWISMVLGGQQLWDEDPWQSDWIWWKHVKVGFGLTKEVNFTIRVNDQVLWRTWCRGKAWMIPFPCRVCSRLWLKSMSLSEHLRDGRLSYTWPSFSMFFPLAPHVRHMTCRLGRLGRLGPWGWWSPDVRKTWRRNMPTNLTHNREAWRKPRAKTVNRWGGRTGGEKNWESYGFLDIATRYVA